VNERYSRRAGVFEDVGCAEFIREIETGKLVDVNHNARET
jgi:hypothetical protein